MNRSWIGVSLVALLFSWLLVPLGAHADAGDNGNALKKRCEALDKSFHVDIWNGHSGGTAIAITELRQRDGSYAVIAADPATVNGTGEIMKTALASITRPVDKSPNHNLDSDKMQVCARYTGPGGFDAQGGLVNAPGCQIVSCVPITWVKVGGVWRMTNVQEQNCANDFHLLCDAPKDDDK
jgi:hypothetical protein